MTVEARSRDGRRWLSPLAWSLALLSAALAGSAVTGAVASGMSLAAAVDGFVVTNAVMGLSFPLCGLILATRRPANPIGWLFLADGLGHAITAAAVPAIVAGMAAGWPVWSLRLVVTVGACAWPWSIALFLPLALLLFPDGKPPGPRWRWLVWAEIVTAPLFVAELGTDPAPLVPGAAAGYLALGDYEHFTPLWTIAELRTVLLYGVSLIALTVRYRRSGERERRQLLWLILAVLIAFGVLIPWGVFFAGPVLMLLAIPLIGAAVTVAIVRHQLLDIRLVVSRTVVYLLLTGAVVVAYVVLVALFDSVLRRQIGLGSSVVATVLIAIGFNPVRVRLQRLVDRAVYGDRSDPVRAASQVGARLVDAGAGLGGVLEALRSALRLPFAALRGVQGEISAAGTAPQTLHAIPLTYGGDRVGELVVGVRTGERRLDPADRAVLELLAAPLAVAVFATALSHELQRSRERIVNAREEERRRLRRDLHDGLGPGAHRRHAAGRPGAQSGTHRPGAGRRTAGRTAPPNRCRDRGHPPGGVRPAPAGAGRVGPARRAASADRAARPPARRPTRRRRPRPARRRTGAAGRGRVRRLPHHHRGAHQRTAPRPSRTRPDSPVAGPRTVDRGTRQRRPGQRCRHLVGRGGATLHAGTRRRTGRILRRWPDRGRRPGDGPPATVDKQPGTSR
jgi:two-component system, NarL family, sensor kinase